MRTSGRRIGGAVCLAAALALPAVCAATPCGAGQANVSGTVVDGSGAPIAGATLAAGGTTAKSGLDGEFLLPCVASDTAIHVEATSFAGKDVKPTAAGRIVLQPLAAHEEISVTAYQNAAGGER